MLTEDQLLSSADQLVAFAEGEGLTRSELEAATMLFSRLVDTLDLLLDFGENMTQLATALQVRVGVSIMP